MEIVRGAQVHALPRPLELGEFRVVAAIVRREDEPKALLGREH
jgi:hypothetical protein